MKDLTQGKESRLIFTFAIPMLVGNIFQQLYNVVDSIIVGKYLGKEALSAVGASFPLIFILIALVIGFSMGLTVIISQFFGAKDYRNVKKSIDTLNIVLFFSSIIVTAIGIGFSEYVFTLIKLPKEIVPMAVSYFNTYMIGNIAVFGFNGTAAILRGLGDSKTPLYFLIISTILNIILVYLFVVVLHLGIRGSAIATVVAQGVAFILQVIYLNKFHKIINFSIFNLEFDKQIFYKSIRIGIPSGMQQTFVALGMLALYSIVNPFGTDVVAAYTAAGRIDSFAMMPAMNFSMALTSFVGQNIGANRIDRVKNGFIAALWMSGLISVIVSVVVIFWGDYLMMLFTTEPTIISLGHDYLIIVCSFYVLFSSMFSFQGVMRGAGDTLIPMIFTLFTLWIIRIPAAYILSRFLGPHGIWWSIPIGWAIGLILSALYYNTGRWKKKAIVKHPVPNADSKNDH